MQKENYIHVNQILRSFKDFIVEKKRYCRRILNEKYE